MIRSERGQTAAEYMGVLLLVAAIIGAIAMGGIGTHIRDAIDGAVCEILGDGDCQDSSTPPGATKDDGDGDGVSDKEERRRGLNPESADSDGDGITDGKEIELGTDPALADTDGDGLPDRTEVAGGGKTSATKADTDADGLSDGEEAALGTDPSSADGERGNGDIGDGLTDAQEIELGTDPNWWDSDADGNPDGYEVRNGDDPTKDERPWSTKVFETFVLDDPVSLLLPGGVLAKALGKNFAKFATEAKAAYTALKNADNVAEAAAARRRILALLRDKAGLAGKIGKQGEPVGGKSLPRFVTSSHGEVVDTALPTLRPQIDTVIKSFDRAGAPPAGVRQGGHGNNVGVWRNQNGDLPTRPARWYTETDVWPGPGPRGAERLILGKNGEVWYTPDHYVTFRRIR